MASLHCPCSVKHRRRAHCTDSRASFLRAAEKLPCLSIRSHVNRASPVLRLKVCMHRRFPTEDGIYYTVYSSSSISVHGLCDLETLLVVYSAKSEVLYTF